MPAPKVFVSYSHDSDAHKQWVLSLAGDLRRNGVDTCLDQWDLNPGQDIVAFMQRGIADADRVLMICSATYVRKAEEGIGGVGYERLIVTGEVIQSIATTKFIPIVRGGTTPSRTPNFLGPRMYVNFENDADYDARLEELLREIHGAPALQKPAIGANPFSSELVIDDSSVRTTGSTGITRVGTQVLNDQWFEDERSKAAAGIAKLGLTGQMELRFALHDAIAKPPIQLVGAARKSTIKTFGWPIGVILENREDYRPRPHADGIRAEVSIPDRGTYDYWSARRNGDYYLLQSLFEDTREKNVVFFNTRIVRVAEALLFASNYYQNLGVPDETALSIRVTHRGLAGRALASASANRMLAEKAVAYEDATSSEIIVPIGSITQRLVDYVKQITEPLFMLFDFQEFDPAVYSDIVQKFERGQST